MSSSRSVPMDIDPQPGAGASTSSSRFGTPGSEHPNLTEFEKRILTLAQGFPKGIPNKILQNDSPSVSGAERATAINNLLSKGLLDLYKQGNELLYKLKSTTNEPAQIKDADEEEKVVYDIISMAGNKGIWIRDIRFKSNLTMPQLNKILKSLETKKLIKAVKSVNASKKKVYMLYDLEPDRSLTGGAWYSDQDFEVEFVTILSQQCLRFLNERLDDAQNKRNEIGPLAADLKSSATLEQIWSFIKDLGISKIELSHDDIETILNTLIYDNKIEKTLKGDKKYYMISANFGEVPPYCSVPCAVCPVAKDCSEFGEINPNSCVYMTNWLKSEIYEF